MTLSIFYIGNKQFSLKMNLGVMVSLYDRVRPGFEYQQWGFANGVGSLESRGFGDPRSHMSHTRV